MNNTTRMIRSGNDRFVLRIYNNHKDPEIARLEHEVLAALQNMNMPFQVPAPIPNKEGDTVSIAEDGTLSAIFRYIDGDRPTSSNPAHVIALGRTAAQLTKAMSELQPAGAPLYSPYYLLEETYSSMDENAFLSMANYSDELASRRSLFQQLQEERRGISSVCSLISRLPKQWIHGDLVFNNTVSQGDEIAGVLDFEFSTVDVRAMELAVIIADLLKPDDRNNCEAKVKLLLGGYHTMLQLSEEEAERLPDLIKLRMLDVALHFAVRLRDGLDDANVLSGIIEQCAFGCSWINKHWEAVRI